MPKKSENNVQKAIGASYTILGALVFFGIIGYILDNQLDSYPFWFIICLFIGVIVGLYELSKYLLK